MKIFDIFKANKIGKNFATQIDSGEAAHKFTRMTPDGSFINNQYGKIYSTETNPSYSRVKIAVDTAQIDLMIKLCRNLRPPYFILYVLVVAREGHQQGRYQSETLESIEEVSAFLNQYKDFFESDGRHHIWVGTTGNSGLIIYDQHNVIFSYGYLDKQINLLINSGFTEKAFEFPAPHGHYYNSNNDKFEYQVLEHWTWQISPLTQDDTYE